MREGRKDFAITKSGLKKVRPDFILFDIVLDGKSVEARAYYCALAFSAAKIIYCKVTKKKYKIVSAPDTFTQKKKAHFCVGRIILEEVI